MEYRNDVQSLKSLSKQLLLLAKISYQQAYETGSSNGR